MTKTYPVTVYLNDQQHGDLAEYAVKNGLMYDSAVSEIINIGLQNCSSCRAGSGVKERQPTGRVNSFARPA